MKKIQLYFLKPSNSQKIKQRYFFQAEILTNCALDQFICLTEITVTVIFNVTTIFHMT